jgi:hypothetical protein
MPARRLAALFAALALPAAVGCGSGSPTTPKGPDPVFEQKMKNMQEMMREKMGGGAGATGKAP